MTVTKALQVMLPDGSIESGSTTATGIQPCHLSYSGTQLGALEFSAVDYWGALREMRLCLEARGVKVLCNGARTDVHPSGMTRSMLGGLRAYVTRMNTKASREDLVDIFDYAPPELVGTVQQQEDHHLEWFWSGAPDSERDKYRK